jgi:glycyl-tRNA synthetase beta chain
VEGFARSQGVGVDQLETRTTPAGEYVYAIKREEGRPTRAVLGAVLHEVIGSLSFTRPMRWGSGDFKFIRPVRWLLALVDGDLVDLEVAGVQSTRLTYGHRTMAPGSHAVSDPGDYFRRLPSLGVFVDGQKRRALILEQARSLAANNGGEPLDDPELLAEVANLVEYPTAFVGHFNRRYLELPAPVLVTTLRHHQRVFPVRAQSGGLLPVFIGVRNGPQSHLEVVRAGNERVIGARLADAEFFFNQDIRTPLSERVPELRRVVFMENLGTMYDRTLRIQELSRVLAVLAGVRESTQAVIARVAQLCKADLVTQVVREFPELQGVMGREYAVRSGEDLAVAEGIHEHYLPRTTDDALPRDLPGLIVGLADRLDTLGCAFAIDLQPTGSQDPFGLRRQALGVAQLLWNSELHLGLADAVARAVAGVPVPVEDPARLTAEVTEFIVQRVRTLFIEAGVRPDVVDAVLAGDWREVQDAWRRATSLGEFVRTPEFEAVAVGYRRVANLARQAPAGAPDPRLLAEPAEEVLYQSLTRAEREARGRLETRNYSGYLAVLAGLRRPIDDFLDQVLVMAPDEQVRNNRLALLFQANRLFSGMADLGLLGGGQEGEPRRAGAAGNPRQRE